MTTSLWIALFLGLAIIAANAFFVAMEYALLASNRLRLQQSAAQGSRSAQRVLDMLKDSDKAIAAVQLGITVAGILLGVVAEEPLLNLLEPIFEPILGAFFAPVVAAAFAGLLALLLLSYFLMVFGELTPKMLVLRAPERTAKLFVYPMWLFSRITAPFVWIVDASTGLVLRLLGVKDARIDHGVAATVDELKMMLEESSRGVLEEDVREMLTRVFDFSERVVREVMTPRTRIIAVERNQTVGELMKLFQQYQYSRFPLYENDLDHITGVVVIKKVMSLLLDDPDLLTRPVGELSVVKDPLLVPESRHIDDLFETMRQQDIGMAIVLDEYGGTAGLVTREQLVEEIMGTMFDEGEHHPLVRRVGAGIVEVDALLRVDEVNEMLGISLPEDDAYDTLAGLILYHLQHVPQPGEAVVAGGYRLEAVRVDGPRIIRVRITRQGQK
jgi:CBS domain containing-hemolysin-like protein